ncbi:MAG: hypothetical protein AAFQ84_12855 [Pseudomonadota bacterium]
MRATLDGGGAPFEITPFIWSGDNSERSRRLEARRLLDKFNELETRGETYAVIGHSHGGSVVARALIEAAARKNELPGLRRWLTVGTPFVELRKERFLFLRLPLVFKAMFVASFMLVFMFLFTVGADLLNGSLRLDNEQRWTRLGMSTLLVALPFLVYYAGAWWKDRGRLFHYSRATRKRANALFAERWLPLTHEDDEAVRGLGSLSEADLQVFSRNFAVPAISLVSVFLLPFAYLWVMLSPQLMVNIADFLKTEVYELDQYETRTVAFEQQLLDLRRVRRQIRRMRAADDGQVPAASERLDQSARMRALTRQRRNLRQAMQTTFPEYREISRAVRFKRRFFEDRRQPCEGGQLCGGGRDLAINSKLLFHLVTDEASTLVLDPETRPAGQFGRLISALIPILLVPLIFAGIAVVLVFFIQWLARGASHVLSKLLDAMTWSEVNRAALGNDTEAEVAIRAAPRPVWLEREPVFLPPALGDLVAAKSNEAAVGTIARLRNALSDLSFVDGAGDPNRSLLAILTWQELIHMVYFEVPAFRSVVAEALAETDAFKLKTPGEPKSKALLAAMSPRPLTRDGTAMQRSA